jgi:hypothetical protein
MRAQSQQQARVADQLLTVKHFRHQSLLQVYRNKRAPVAIEQLTGRVVIGCVVECVDTLKSTHEFLSPWGISHEARRTTAHDSLELTADIGSSAETRAF